MTGIALYALIVGGLLAAIYRAPVVAVAPVLCMFGLEQWAQIMVPFFFQYHTLMNLLAGSMVILALVLMYLRNRDIALDYSTAGWLVLLLFFYAFTSVMWAPNSAFGWTYWQTNLPYVITILVLGPLLINRVSDFQVMCWSTLVLGGVLIGLLLIFAEWDGRFIVLAEGVGNENLGNPLAVSQVAGYVALAAIFLHSKKTGSLYRTLRWLLVASCFVVAVKSGSRGQFFGILLIAPFLFLFASPSSSVGSTFWRALGIGVMLILGQWALTNFAESARWEAEGIGAATEERFEKAFLLLEYWYSSPEALYFGLGNSSAWELVGSFPHVAPLEILAEEGFVGFALFLAIVSMATRSVIRVYRLVKHDDGNRGALLTLTGWFFYELLLSCKQGSLLGSLLMFLFAALLNKYERMVVSNPVFNAGLRPAYREAPSG